MAGQLARIFNDKSGYMYHNTGYEIGEAITDGAALAMDIIIDGVLALDPATLALGIVFDGI